MEQYRYQVFTIDSLNTTDATEVLNNWAKEGWRLHSAHSLHLPSGVITQYLLERPFVPCIGVPLWDIKPADLPISLREMRIEALDLRLKVTNALRVEGIKVIGDIFTYGGHRLINIRYFGPIAQEEVEQRLTELIAKYYPTLLGVQTDD